MRSGMLILLTIAALGTSRALAAESYADYPPQLEVALSISNLDHRTGSFNQMLQRFRDIPENGELKWLHYRVTDLPGYDLEVWVEKAGRDDGWASANLSFANALFISVGAAGIPYNVDAETGFRRFKTRGSVEWFPTRWLTLYGERSEEDKTGLRSPEKAVGQKAEKVSLGATANWKPVFWTVEGFEEDLSETEFGNSLKMVTYTAQYQPGDRLRMAMEASTAALGGRRLAGPSASGSSLNTVSAEATYDLGRDWSVDLRYEGVDFGDPNEGGLDVRSARLYGAVDYFFPGGRVEAYAASEDRDYVGGDISGHEIDSSGIRASYRYKGYQLNAFLEAQNRDTSGIFNIHLTNTEDLPLQTRVSGGTLSGMPLANLFVQYNIRFVENNYNRVDVVGVSLHKIRNQSVTASYPISDRLTVSYTFSDNEFLSRASRYFTGQDTEVLTTQLVEDSEYHRFYLDIGMGNNWSGSLGYGISRSAGAEEFAENKVKAYDYETVLRYRASDKATMTLKYLYDSYQDQLELSPSARGRWIELWITLKI